MFKLAFGLLIILVSINSLSFIDDSTIFFKILGHGLLMPICGLIYGIIRKWQFGQIDKLIMLACLVGSICDVVIFFDLNEKGEFLQITTAFFLHLIFIIVFRKEGAFVFNIGKTNILKVIIPAMLIFFFFGFVLLTVLPSLLYFIAILYAVEVTILAILGYFRPVSNRKYWFVAIGVSALILKDFLYSYFFYIYKGSQHLLYIPLYWTNAIGYFLIIYGIALNQNSININYEKVSIKVLIDTLKNILHVYKKKEIKSRIYETLFLIDKMYVGKNLDEA